MINKSQKSTRLFGTNGIRGIPNMDLTPEFCSRVGKAIGTVFKTRDIAMGKDTRVSGEMIWSAVESGILSTGVNVTDLGILPTPALQYYCKVHSVYGVIITASHNPPKFNGIKCIDKDGTELQREREEEIEFIVEQGEFMKADVKNMGQRTFYPLAVNDYIEGIKKIITPENVKKAEFRVAIDTGNGAAFRSSPELLTELNCKVVTLNANPDGNFTSRNSEPKPENLGDLIALMKTGKFDLGVAHDGDADRCVFVDENGNFIDGDRSLALIVKYFTSRGSKVVTPVSSSDVIEDVCNKNGAVLVKTRVGAPIVSRTMIKEKALVGGEENGGIIYGRHQYCRDGAMAMALVLDLMAREKKKISALLSDLPAYAMYKTSTELTEDWNQVRKRIIDRAGAEEIDFTDGLKLYLREGWVLARPSGTEPIMRIFAQSKTVEKARELAEFIIKIASP
ncbi:phosphoglucosamine mutase [Oxyplasma meridianum]|uniref:Phosphoglucosamine mutase n=1 Tax=Oxyplasma meridianum TaxID=3073602 RepID=A0AAX4NFF6_9ARCH